jgi:D-alanyl-D-alanine carboxypeptidase/D-alanyl-D-alanine-endopeptidase (penicillin-binding protein 4)
LVLPSSYPKLKFVPAKVLGKDVLATRRPFTHPLVVAKRGKLAKSEKVKITPLNPGKWVAGVLTAMLTERGVKFLQANGQQSAGRDSLELKHHGQPLAATLKHFNHESENAVGEMLLHEIAIAQETKKPKWADGAKFMADWLVDTVGLEKGSFRLVDGSGLSRYNLISADSSVRLLAFMHKHPHAQVFYDALKPYEVELDGKKQKHLVVAKPGGMGGVSTISGYLTTTRGQKLAFSLLANGYIGSAEPVFGLRQKVWEALAKHEGSQ